MGPASTLERAMMALAAAGLGLGLAGAAGAAGAPPFGEDSAFWGARAVFLASGDVGGEHPPLYPAVAAALHLMLGLPTVRAAQGLSLMCWVLLPPAMSMLGARLGGPLAGRWTGWLTLGLPTLAAWGTRVEPTTMLALATVGVGIAVASPEGALLAPARSGRSIRAGHGSAESSPAEELTSQRKREQGPIVEKAGATPEKQPVLARQRQNWLASPEGPLLALARSGRSIRAGHGSAESSPAEELTSQRKREQGPIVEKAGATPENQPVLARQRQNWLAEAWPPLLVGALCGMLVGLKESGGLLGVALLAVAIGQAGGQTGGRVGPSGGRTALLGGLGFLLAAGGVGAIIAVHMPVSGLGGRVTMPLEQAWALVSRGESMSAMAAPDVPTWAVPGWLKRAIGAPGGWPATRAVEFMAVQGFRTLAMAGPWAFALGPALLSSRSFASSTPARWIPLALLASGLPLGLVVFQSRHIEVPLLGAVLAVGLALGRRAESRIHRIPQQRGWDGLAWTALVIALGWTGVRLVSIELPRARFAVRCASEQAAALDRAAAHIPLGAALCSNEPWLHFVRDEPIRTCQEVPFGWPLVVAPPGRPAGPPIAGAIPLGRCCAGAIVLLPPEAR